jgi:hypothetical protein
MTKSLKKACADACALLRKKGIVGMEKIPVYFDFFDIHSGCFEEPVVKIGVGWAYGLRSLWDLEGTTAFMVHEYAHAFLYQLWPLLSDQEKAQWQDVFGSYSDDPNNDPYPTKWEYIKSYILNEEDTYDETRFVSAYATVSAQEDWAETMAFCVLGEDIVRTPAIREKVALISEFVRKHRHRVITQH